MVAVAEAAETKTFRDMWSPKQYLTMHTARYLLTSSTLYLPDGFKKTVKGSSSVIPIASRTFAVTGDAQGQIIRIGSLTKWDVKENFVFL